MSKIIKYHLLNLNKKIGFFEISEDREYLKVTLFDDLDWIDIPPEFEVGYERKGQREFFNDEVFEWIAERVIPHSRQDIEEILIKYNLEEYDEIALFLLGDGHFSCDDYYIEKID